MCHRCRRRSLPNATAPQSSSSFVGCTQNSSRSRASRSSTSRSMLGPPLILRSCRLCSSGAAIIGPVWPSSSVQWYILRIAHKQWATSASCALRCAAITWCGMLGSEVGECGVGSPPGRTRSHSCSSGSERLSAALGWPMSHSISPQHSSISSTEPIISGPML